jgi:hypothetical protein
VSLLKRPPVSPSTKSGGARPRAVCVALWRILNGSRKELSKPPLQSYYRDFALLQEVTKAACRSLCGEITIIHTSAVIPPFSVSSFFEVGLDLGFIHPDDMIAFEAG